MGVDLSKLFRRNDEPANGLFAVTPSNTVVFDNKDTNPPLPSALYIGTGGNIAVVAADGSSGVIENVLGGTILPIRVKQVLATGTTATKIIGLY